MAVQTNKDQWVNAFSKSINSASPQNNADNPGQENEMDKYDALKYTSYKDMLSSKIQASAAKEQAQKYVGTALGNSGFAGQGVAESTHQGIMNAYGKAITEADATHQANLVDIEKQQQEEVEAKGQEKWQSAMTMMQQAQSQADLDYIKENFYEDMTDEQKKMFDYYYASYSNSFGSEFSSYGDAADQVFNEAFNVDENGNPTGVKNEIAYARYTYNKMQESGYYVQGLSGGGKTDDIDITIGSSTRDKKNEYDLIVGDEVAAAKANSLTQAVGGQAPSEGTLVISGNSLYVYTKKGWHIVSDDRSKVSEAIAAFKKLGIYVY